jgi:transcriptional regulator with XRE-family HTH domain
MIDMGIEDVTAYLRSLRSQQGISQAVLANHMGLSLRQVSRWETGESREVSSEALLRAMVFLNASWDRIRELMTEPVPPPPDPESISEERAAQISDRDVLALIDTVMHLRDDPRKFAALADYASSLADK